MFVDLGADGANEPQGRASDGKNLTFTVRRFTSCWTARSIGFDAGNRRRQCSGRESMARPSGTFSARHTTSLGAVSLRS